jgi:hypothetical protein
MSKYKIEKNQSSGVGAELAPPASADDPAAAAQAGGEPAGAGAASIYPTTAEATPGAVAGDAKTPPPRIEKKLNRPDPAEEKAWQEARRKSDVLSLAHSFAAAMLQNPKIDIFLYGSPLEAGTRGEHPNAGALLAKGAKRLAEDYLTALQALHSSPAPAPMPVPESTTEAEAGHPTNDFPLD